MATFTTRTSSIPNNSATVSSLGGQALSTGGGYITAAPTVTKAGSADALVTLYDGTGTDGTVLATFSTAQAGPAMMPNNGYVTGLYVNVSGTTAGTFTVVFTGPVAG